MKVAFVECIAVCTSAMPPRKRLCANMGVEMLPPSTTPTEIVFSDEQDQMLLRCLEKAELVYSTNPKLCVGMKCVPKGGSGEYIAVLDTEPELLSTNLFTALREKEEQFSRPTSELVQMSAKSEAIQPESQVLTQFQATVSTEDGAECMEQVLVETENSDEVTNATPRVPTNTPSMPPVSMNSTQHALQAPYPLIPTQTTKVVLTAEQRNRIEENKRLAKEKLAAKQRAAGIQINNMAPGIRSIGFYG